MMQELLEKPLTIGPRGDLAAPRQGPPSWSAAKIWLAAALISAVYLPFLNTGFDFADDGVLTYPSTVSSLAEFLERVQARTINDFETRGPFRPVAWAIWTAQSELFQGDAYPWRVVRQLWIVLSAAVFLLLLKDLGIRPGASMLVVALSMWNPYRVEIWLGLNFMEGSMMPLALGSLVCAIRAARSARPWVWDLTGIVCTLAAVLSKNVFVAVIPAQMFLRVAAAGLPWRESLKRHAIHACVLGLVAIVPVVHFVAYKANFKAGQYAVAWTGQQPVRLLRSMGGGVALEYMAPVLILGTWLLYRRRGAGFGHTAGVNPAARCALAAGVLLFLFGYLVYVPIEGVAGRYVVPGVWGLEILLGLFFTSLAAVPASAWKRTAYALAGCALAAVTVANIGKQTKVHARIAMFWDALEAVKKEAEPSACVGWVGVNFQHKTGNLLEVGEGYHFAMHLAERGRADLQFAFLDPDGQALPMPEISTPRQPPRWLVSGGAAPPGGNWTLVAEFARSYWAGLRQYQCYLWKE